MAKTCRANHAILERSERRTGRSWPRSRLPRNSPPPVAEAPKGEPVPVQQAAMFIVFFDWDKSNITAGGNDVLDAVAQEIKNRKDVKALHVVGHTDTSGSGEA